MRVLALVVLVTLSGCSGPGDVAEGASYDHPSAVVPAAPPQEAPASSAPILVAVADVHVPYVRAGVAPLQVRWVVAVHADGGVSVADAASPGCADAAPLREFLRASGTAPNSTVPATWLDAYEGLCVGRTTAVPPGAWGWIAPGLAAHAGRLAGKPADVNWESRAVRGEICEGCFVALHVAGNAAAAQPGFLRQQAADADDPGSVLAAAAALHAEAVALRDWARA